MTAILDSW